MKTWDQCTALVTGGRGDIGSAIAGALRSAGATVYVTSREPQSDQTCENSATLLWDMADPKGTSALLNQIKSQGLKFDLLVHCAHRFSDARLIPQVNAEQFAQSLNVNIAPLYELMRALARTMHRQRFGRILLMGSLISVYGGAGKIPYIVEKSAFNGLAKGFNAEFGGANVFTAVLHPSIVHTDTIAERVPAEVLQQVAEASNEGKLLSVADVVAESMALLDPAGDIADSPIRELSGGAQW